MDEGLKLKVPVGAKISPLHIIQTSSGTHPGSYPMGTGGLSPGVKRPGREADRSPPTSAEVNNTWIYTATTLYVFMVQCLVS
jgi:hypothetical protein